ncbi:hypothetical protein IDH01_01690 [Pelagibacterales bacterium SAG-MED08]|nr:hypothetical protein [Pelagibacterales bacterium SAG-MED08]
MNKNIPFIIMQFVGYILIIIGVADFLLGNFAQINLTYFLGSLSTFTPYVFGGIGLLILNMGKK